MDKGIVLKGSAVIENNGKTSVWCDFMDSQMDVVALIVKS